MNETDGRIFLLDIKDKKIQLLTSVLHDAAISIHRSHSNGEIYTKFKDFKRCEHPFCVRVRNALDA